MKRIPILIILTALLGASEFKYIQPIAVEEAPQKIIVKKEQSFIMKEIPEQIVENTSNLSDNIVPKDDNSTKTAELQINFASNKYNISNKYRDKIEKFVQYLQENDSYQIVIYGHADSIGSDMANKILSQNRANSILQALEKSGIPSIRITAIGKGEGFPIADNSSEAGRAKNRRIEVNILK